MYYAAFVEFFALLILTINTKKLFLGAVVIFFSILTESV